MSNWTRRGIIGSAAAAATSLVGLAAAANEEHTQGPSATAESRLKLAGMALEAVRANLGRGRFNPGERDPIVIWSRRRLEARLDLSTSRSGRIAAAREHLGEMRTMEEIVLRMNAAGEVDRLSLMDAQYRRLEAEKWLEQEEAKKA